MRARYSSGMKLGAKVQVDDQERQKFGGISSDIEPVIALALANEILFDLSCRAL